MRHVAAGLAVLLTMLAVQSPVEAQSALQQLEQKLGTTPTTAPAIGYLGLTGDDRQEAGRGVRVVEVVAEGPAQKDGLKVGDLVVGIGTTDIHTMAEFAKVLESSPPGTKLSFKIERDGTKQDVSVTLGTRPPDRNFDPPAAVAPPTQPMPIAPPSTNTQPSTIPPPVPTPAPKESTPTGTGERHAVLGVQVTVITPDAIRALNLPDAKGALVVNVVEGSPAHKAGIAPDSVITSFNEQDVDSPDTLTRLVAASAPGDKVPLAFRRLGGLVVTEVTLVEASPAMMAREPLSVTLVPGAPSNVLGAPTPPPEQYPNGASKVGTELPQYLAILQNRVSELERRVAELEKKLAEKP